MYRVDIIKNRDADTFAQLKDIWIEAFADPEDYVAFCLSHLPENVKIVAAIDGIRILGALYLFPFRIMPGDISAYYGYAGAVRRECQGYSVYPDLMRSTIDFTRGENSQLMGSAADASMIKPYKRLGFKEIYQCVEETFMCPDFEDTKPLKRRGLSIGQWKAMRPELEVNQYYMVHDDGWLSYLKELKNYSGDVCESVNLNGSWYSVIGYYESNVLVIDESSAPKQLLLKNAAALCKTYDINRLKLRFPVTKVNGEQNTVYNAQGTFDRGYLWASLLN